jgi:uncharacterized protein
LPPMKKNNKNKYWTAIISGLIIISLVAIGYVILFPQEETVNVKSQARQKRPVARSKTVGREKLPAPVKEASEPGKNIQQTPSADVPRLEKEKIVVAKAVPPRLTVKQVAIIIDDIGQDMKPVRELLRIDADITFAILPLLAHSREASEVLYKANREILLHLPMEPLSYPKEKPGSGALFTEMNQDEIIFQMGKDLASVPHISGVNNHMGSKFMADEEKLLYVFKQLKKHDLFFIDSRTTPSSKTMSAAGKTHLMVASRKVFLDHDRDYSKIYQILMDVAATPAGNMPLIVIGHPYPETIRALRDAQKVFQEKGISIIPVSKLMKKNAPEGTS